MILLCVMSFITVGQIVLEEKNNVETIEVGAKDLLWLFSINSAINLLTGPQKRIKIC